MSKKKNKQNQMGVIMEDSVEQSVEEVEQVETPAEVVEQPADDLVEFDSWWALRAPKIPRQHYKEIVKADMKARGVQRLSTIAQYDEALLKYGIKL